MCKPDHVLFITSYSSVFTNYLLICFDGIALLQVSRNVAVAVIEEGLKEGLTTKILKKDIDEGLSHFVERKMYNPSYYPLTSDRH